MSENRDSQGDPLPIGEITIVRVLTDDGDMVDSVTAVTPDGDDLPLSEALGMLWLGGDTLIRDRTGGRDD